MRYLRQSTATHVAVGPFVDFEDGITTEESITGSTQVECNRLRVESGEVVNQSITLSETVGGDNEFVHIVNGWYELDLTATDTNTLGRVIFTFGNPAAGNIFIPLWVEFQVITAEAYDDMFSTTLTTGGTKDLVQKLHKIQTNKWIIDDTASPPELQIMDDDDSTVLYRFSLYDKDGVGSHVNVYERRVETP